MDNTPQLKPTIRSINQESSVDPAGKVIRVTRVKWSYGQDEGPDIILAAASFSAANVLTLMQSFITEVTALRQAAGQPSS